MRSFPDARHVAFRDAPTGTIVLALGLLAIAGCGPDRSAEASGSAAPATSDSAVATLEDAHGDVRYRAAAAASWTDARPSQPLAPADSVQTMADGRAGVRFHQNEAVVSLGPSTTLRIPDQAPDVARFAHLSGRLVARVEPGARRSRMEVDLPPGTLVLEVPEHARDGAVEARLDVDAERTEIAVTEGRARLDRNQGAPLDVRAEHFVSLAADGTVLQEGRSGEAAVPSRPADGERVVTRQAVDFAWQPLDGAAGYRLAIVPDEGEPREVTTSAPHASVELESGTYRWTARGLVDGEPLPASAPRHVDVVLDRTPPALTLLSPEPSATVRGPVEVRGRTEPGARVEVDGRPVDVGPDGAFDVRHPVARGLVNVVVRATDPVGNARVISRSVLRE